MSSTRCCSTASCEFASEVPIAAYPTTLFVSPEGRIVHQTNAIDADQLRATIDEVF